MPLDSPYSSKAGFTKVLATYFTFACPYFSAPNE
jgi:hypothetical protein